jgi:hypothetical protein
MAKLVIGFFHKGERIGSETIPEVMDRLTQRVRAQRLAEAKYPEADTIVGMYQGWSGNDSFTIKL